MEFKKAHNCFIDAIASKSLQKVRQQLKQLKVLDENLARKCCMKSLCSLSEEEDYDSVAKEIVESQLFQPPHHHSLCLVASTLIYNAAKRCMSAEKLLENLTHLASQLFINFPEILDILDEDGYSALHLSVMNGDMKVTKILLKLGSDCNQKSESGNTALSVAIAYGYDYLVPLFLNTSDVNTLDRDHDTPLMFAAWNKKPKIISALIDSGAIVNTKNKYGSTAIWNAVYQSSPDCVSRLLSHNSAMDVACKGTHLFLNENDINHNEERITKLYPEYKRSLLWVAVDRIAVNKESLKVLLILLEAGYDVTKEHWLKNDTKYPVDCPKILHSNLALLGMLQFLYKQPQNLKDLCRNTLRKHHRLSNLSFHEWLGGLQLPPTLNNFFTLSYNVE